MTSHVIVTWIWQVSCLGWLLCRPNLEGALSIADLLPEPIFVQPQ